MPDQRPSLGDRAEAAKILRQFRDGEITNDEFEDAYRPLCHRAQDRALSAIGDVVWGFYDDLHEHTLEPLHGDSRALFDRCILFLQSDLPYAWERDTFLGLPGVTWLIRRVSRIGKRLLSVRPEEPGLRPGPESQADWSVWPFQDDHDFTRLKRSIVPVKMWYDR